MDAVFNNARDKNTGKSKKALYQWELNCTLQAVFKYHQHRAIQTDTKLKGMKNKETIKPSEVAILSVQTSNTYFLFCVMTCTKSCSQKYLQRQKLMQTKQND